MPRKTRPKNHQNGAVHRAPASAVEPLEPRALFAGDTSVVQALPYILNFDKTRKGIVDVGGQGTGFSIVQPNNAGNEYQRNLIDIDPGGGVLRLTTSGSSSAGSNYGADNTQTNALGTQFNGASGTFSISTTLKGPLSYIDQKYEQAGVYFGPDQDNYVKIVANVGNAGAGIQFLAETRQGADIVYPLNASGVNVAVGLSSVTSLTLTMTASATTGKIQAFYQINGGSTQKLGGDLQLTSAQRANFFGGKSRAGIIASHKNNIGPMTVVFDRFAIQQLSTGNPAPSDDKPSIIAVRPGDGATGVSRDSFVAADVFLPTAGAGVDAASFSSDSVRLERVSDGRIVAATLNTSGGGDSVVLQPLVPLDANTLYRFVVSAGLKDAVGASFTPFESTFTTGSAVTDADQNIAFEKIRLPQAEGRLFSGVQIGPDGRLYATTLTGEICRWEIDTATGALGPIEVIETVILANGDNRFITGLAFDPASTADNLIAWVTHSDYAFENAENFTGAVSRLTGPKLAGYRDMVVGLPRSIRDHLTNQPSFGPDGALYFAQAAMTAMGAADATWGNRPETQLSAAVLRLDTTAVVNRRNAGLGPLNVRTTGSNPYDPYNRNAALKIYATGVRNSYDLLFHSNGRLYAPTNGSGAGGNTPKGGGAPALNRLNATQSDYLFDVAEGGYYGHPNPTRDEFVLNGGNPTSGGDKNEVTQYPVGTQPDSNYRSSAFDFGKSYSPNGIVEYQSNSFRSRLKGKILVARYSGGDDIMALSVDKNGKITASQTGITGLTHFVDPLDLVEDTRTGCLYVVEFGAEKITLVRPVTPGPNLTVDSNRLLFNDIRTDSNGATETLTLRNSGTVPLTLAADAFRFTGGAKGRFSIIDAPSLPRTIPVDGEIKLTIAFTAAADTSLDPKAAVLEIRSNDPDQPMIKVRLRGLATKGTGGALEPSLQRVLDLHEIPVNVGDSNPLDTFLNPPMSVTDEILAQRLVKAASGAVTIEPLAMFGVNTNPALRFGYYEPGTGANYTELFTVNGKDSQSVNVFAQGSTMFDPGDNKPFGLFGLFPNFRNTDGSVRIVYQEDSLNSWESIANNRRKVRFYPLKTPTGDKVANAYVFAFEEFTRDYDQQDFVGIIRNVKIASSGPEIGIENLDGSPFFNRLVFNTIATPNADIPNAVHNTATLRIRNTGDENLVIDRITSSEAWDIISGGGSSTIAPGAFRDVRIRFVATGGDSYTGTLNIRSNDPDEPLRTVNLGGFWQSHSENNPSTGRSQEPTLGEIFAAFGYTTSALFGNQSIDTGGNIKKVGDEVLSSYWVRADGSQPVRVRQLAAFHQQGNTATISYFNKGSTSPKSIFTSAGVDGQTFLPRKQATTSTEPAAGSFALPTSQAFGFKVDQVWSEQANNDTSRGGEGHYMRFYPVLDQNGQFIENTWIMAMDYERILADYQDNVYLIENMAPADSPTPPDGLNGVRSGGRVVLDWADNPERNIIGYNIFRSLSPTSGYKARNAVLVTSSMFTESIDFAEGTLVYYRISAVTSDGKESIPASVVVVA